MTCGEPTERETYAFKVDISVIDPIVRSCSVVVVKSGSIHSTKVLSTTCIRHRTSSARAERSKGKRAHHLVDQTNEFTSDGGVVDTTRIDRDAELHLAVVRDKVSTQVLGISVHTTRDGERIAGILRKPSTY